MADMAAARGTRLHKLAHDLIYEKVKLPRTSATLNSYVNDAIGLNLKPEQPLMYSWNCFGTPDAIGFEKNWLRIHDLKTGVTESSFKQLYVYAAMWCLEYGFQPSQIKIELRLYQNDEIRVEEASTPEVARIMDKIVTFDARINDIRKEMLP